MSSGSVPAAERHGDEIQTATISRLSAVLRGLRPMLWFGATCGFLVVAIVDMLDGDPTTSGLPAAACALACSALMEISHLRLDFLRLKHQAERTSSPRVDPL